jgi:hypothetical protein
MPNSFAILRNNRDATDDGELSELELSPELFAQLR